MPQEVHFTINSKAVVAKTNSEKAKCFANVLGATMKAKPYLGMALTPIKTRHWDDELIIDCDELDSKLRGTAPGEDNITYDQTNKVLSNLKLLYVHY